MKASMSVEAFYDTAACGFDAFEAFPSRPRPVFRSFWQAGFECSTQRLRTGRRLDLVASTQHDVFAMQDYARVQAAGMRTVREGLRWHLIEPQRGVYDFSSVMPIWNAQQRYDIQVIWDLLHFGWPDFLDVFQPEWIEAFAEFARRFGLFARAHSSRELFISAVNEISFVAWAGGDQAYLNPFATGRGKELKRQLVRATIAAIETIRSTHPNVRVVSPEPCIHIEGNPAVPGDVQQAVEYQSSMYEAWDMIAGTAQPELGGSASYLDILGVNYYPRNQWWNHGPTIFREEPGYRPFRELLADVYRRHQRPIFVSETGTEDEDRLGWLSYIAQEVNAAIEGGVPVEGICLYPILNHPGWDDDRHCRNGLWDYAEADGTREPYGPLLLELETRIHNRRKD